MTSRRTTPSLSRLLAVAAGTLSIGFASTAFAQRAGTHPVPVRAAPRTSSYPLQQPRHTRIKLRHALRRGGHAPVTRAGPAKPRAVAPLKAPRAPTPAAP